MVKINLLPQKIRKTKVVVQLYSYFILAVSVVALILVLLLLNMLAQTRKIDARIEQIRKAQTALADKTGPLQELLRWEKQAAELAVLQEKLSTEQVAWLRILDELAGKIQPDLWLTQIKSDRKNTPGDWLITLEGQAYQKFSVADFLTVLEQSEFFSQVNLQALKEIQVNRQAQIQFQLTMHCQMAQTVATERKP